MNKFMEANKRIENAVVGGYKTMENSVLSGYQAVEDTFVGGYKRIENKFVEAFLSPDKPSGDEAPTDENKEMNV